MVITMKLGDSACLGIGGACCHCLAYSQVLADGVILFLELFLLLLGILDLCFLISYNIFKLHFMYLKFGRRKVEIVYLLLGFLLLVVKKKDRYGWR